MKLKSKFFLFFLILLFILFVLGVNRIEKKILFLKQKTQQFEKSINELNSRIAVLIKRGEFLTTGLELSESETSDIKSKSNIYNIKTFNLPFLSREEWVGKPAAYLEQTDNEIIFASSSGEFFSFKKKDIGFDNLDLKVFSINKIWDQLIQKGNLFAKESNVDFLHVSTLNIYKSLLEKHFKH